MSNESKTAPQGQCVDPHYEWMKEVVSAAKETLLEARHIHEGNSSPLKYRAPYGGLVKLGELFDKEPA